MDLNLMGPISLFKVALPYMLENNFGQIINISSATGIMPAPLSSAYCASKHGMHVSLSNMTEHPFQIKGVLLCLFTMATRIVQSYIDEA